MIASCTTFKKSVFAALLALILPMAVQAQKCKFDEDKKDPFGSGNHRLVTHKIGPPSWNWNFSLEQNDGKFYISMRMLRAGKMDEVYPAGRKVMLKLENGTIMELSSSQDFLPAFVVSNDGIIWTNYIPKFEVSQQVVTDLSASRITDVKVTLGTENILLPKITEKQTEKIKESAGCLLK
ncbi:MAG: hypothetical protein EOO01_29080 [Chitinophagaceae bacterium]|nr:MAG: hypothetical protein EOO01_29080 [Chitinophagaceae bacterium]